MDFRELSYVIAIAHHKNITRAAEALFVSQPTLSKFLKALEADLGVKLFQKLGNKYVLTYAGERYVSRAEQILQIKFDLDKELSDIIKRDIGVLKIAFPTMRCTYILPQTLPAFQTLYPNVKVQIHEGHSEDIDNMILNGEAEIAFYTQPSTPHPVLEYDILGKEELLICTCKNHPIGKFAQPNPASRYPKLDVAHLKEELVLMMLPSQRTGQIIQAYLQEQAIHLENVIYTSNMPAIMELVAMNYGVAFVFEPHLKHQKIDGVIDCYSFGNPRTVSNVVAAYRRGSYLPVYAKKFLELVRQLYE